MTTIKTTADARRALDRYTDELIAERVEQARAMKRRRMIAAGCSTAAINAEADAAAERVRAYYEAEVAAAKELLA